MILADFILASALALSAAIIMLQSTAMLVRQSTAAKIYRDDAYAFAALIEEVAGGVEGGVAKGRMGWRVDVQSAETRIAQVPLCVARIVPDRERGFAGFEWEFWQDGER